METQLNYVSLLTALNDFLFVFRKNRETELVVLADIMTGKCRCAHPDSMAASEEILTCPKPSDRDRGWDEIVKNFMFRNQYSNFFSCLRDRAEGEFHYGVYIGLRDLTGLESMWTLDATDLIDGYRKKGLTVAQIVKKLYVELECGKMNTGADEAEF